MCVTGSIETKRTPCLVRPAQHRLAAFVYAVEHLKVASYEFLGRVGRRVGDQETGRLCATTLEQERDMAARLHLSFDAAVQAPLEPTTGPRTNLTRANTPNS